MVYFSHNWGMGDSDCMPCYETVDLHHRPTTTPSTASPVNNDHQQHEEDEHDIDHRQSAPSDTVINGPRKVGVQLPIDLSIGKGGGAAAEKSLVVIGGGSAGSTPTEGEHNRQKQQQQHILLRKPLTPAASEDHHDSDYDEISIHPLSNQVGGHTRLLLLNQNTVIKPLNIRELDFYQNIPKDIQVFVPKYKGVMQATMTGGNKIDKRYSPSFRNETTGRKSSASKRKREDVLRMKVHKNGNAADVIKSISQIDNSNKQC